MELPWERFLEFLPAPASSCLSQLQGLSEHRGRWPSTPEHSQHPNRVCSVRNEGVCRHFNKQSCFGGFADEVGWSEGCPGWKEGKPNEQALNFKIIHVDAHMELCTHIIV